MVYIGGEFIQIMKESSAVEDCIATDRNGNDAHPLKDHLF